MGVIGINTPLMFRPWTNSFYHTFGWMNYTYYLAVIIEVENTCKFPLKFPLTAKFYPLTT